LLAAGQEGARHGLQRPNSLEFRAAVSVTHIAIEDKVAGIGTVAEAGDQILVAVAVEIMEGNGHPASLAFTARKNQDLAMGRQFAAGREVVFSRVLPTIHERFDSSLEQVEIAIAVKIRETIKVTDSELAPAELLGESIAVAQQSCVAARTASMRFFRVKINGEVRLRRVRHQKIQRDSRHAIE
jgi:hypothetical protein